jgi:hypothetical protein
MAKGKIPLLSTASWKCVAKRRSGYNCCNLMVSDGGRHFSSGEFVVNQGDEGITEGAIGNNAAGTK